MTELAAPDFRRRMETVEEAIGEILRRINCVETAARVRKAMNLGAERIELTVCVSKTMAGPEEGKWRVAFRYNECMNPDRPWAFVALI